MPYTNEIVIIVGGNLVEQIQNWQSANQLIKSYCFAVVPRGGFERVLTSSYREIPLDLSNFESTEISSTIISSPS